MTQITKISTALRDWRTAQNKRLEDVGAIFDVHKTTILVWETRGVPAERVVEIEEKTGILREKLRPDLYLRTVVVGAA